MAEQTAQQIAQWAEAHTGEIASAPNKGCTHLTPDEIAEVLHWQTQGLTQEQIAAKFEPQKHQSTISRCLKEWGPDRTAEAKRMVRAMSPRLAHDIIMSRDTKTKAVLLKGVDVLSEQQSQGVTVIVGGGGTVNVGIALSPPPRQLESESSQNP